MILATFVESLIVFSAKVNLLFFLYGPEVLSFASDKAIAFDEIFLNQVSLYVFVLLKLI